MTTVPEKQNFASPEMPVITFLPVPEAPSPPESLPLTKEGLIRWCVFVTAGLAITCILPLANETWWFAPGHAVFRQLLDMLRAAFIIGLFICSKLVDQYTTERKTRQNRGSTK
jgi:hypothetical protein